MAKERLTCGDIFAGGGGWSLGAIAAGLEPIWAIENDPAVAECYAANIGQHVIVEQAQSVDIRRLDAPDVLLASPPCQSHSNARSKRLAARDDAEVGLCVLDYVRILRPRFVFIENVEGWKRSHSFKAIFHGLHSFGYWCDVQVLNSADFSVPQTRRRLILRASREGMLPALPLPVAWRGWYQAIEDLIDGLPESRFADWQIRRLPEGLLSSLLVGGGNTNKDQIDSVARDESQPAFTVASNAGWSTRAWLDSGRVVAMSLRALARFQSFPDSYELPDKASLACKIIGNAMPPLFAQRLLEGLL